MQKKHFMAAASVAVILMTQAAFAADDVNRAELTALRQELQRIREAYELRITALEERLALNETRAPAARAQAVSEGAFNPAISLILAGTYTRLTQDPAKYSIQGFVPPRGDIAAPRRGFGLGESELAITANIDPTLRGTFTAAVAAEDGTVAVEEAHIQSLGLGEGLTLKAGRFFSGIGYLNEQHAHAWDFADAPLAYKAFLANQLRNDGVQAKWQAPTELSLELGGEAGNGGAFPSTDRNKNGNTLATLFAHVAGDVGTSHSWRGGLSMLATSPRDRAFSDLNQAADSFSGRSRTWIADFVWKWAPNGNGREQNFKIQGEYMSRRESGDITYNAAAVVPAIGSFASKQSGYYLQGVYQFMPRLRVGYRHDRLDSGTPEFGGKLTAADFPLLAGWKPRRDTVMFDYSASEFSRVRLQLARDWSFPGLVDNQLWLQYIVAMGAHGAHKY